MDGCFSARFIEESDSDFCQGPFWVETGIRDIAAGRAAGVGYYLKLHHAAAVTCATRRPALHALDAIE